MISVTILTKNSERYLAKVLKALTQFNEVAILDTGSKDSTLEIAKQFSNVTIHKAPFEGFGPSHNHISQLARNDWILSIDSDEIATPELASEILSLQLDSSSVYSFCRHNFYRGRFIKGCGWYPDRVVRLYNRTKTAFSNDLVHERVLSDHMRRVDLQNPVEHYPYFTISDFLTKMQSYSTLFAEQYKGKKSSSFFKALTHGLASFLKSYILKKGFLLGSEGFEISVYNGNTAFYKYLKLREANEQLKK